MFWWGALMGSVGTLVAVGLLQIWRRWRGAKRLSRAMYNHPGTSPATALFLESRSRGRKSLFRKTDSVG